MKAHKSRLTGDVGGATWLPVVVLLSSAMGGCYTKHDQIMRWQKQGAVEPLTGVLRGDDSTLRRAYMSNWMGKTEYSDLVANERLRAAIALGEIGQAGAIEPLGRALRSDPDPKVRCAAADALRKIGGSQSVDALIAALKNGDPSVREKSAAALGELGDARAIKPLEALLDDGYRAKKWLGGWGGPTDRASLQYYRWTYPVRNAARVAIGRISRKQIRQPQRTRTQPVQ